MPQKYQKSWENHEISNHVAWPWHVFIQTCNSQSLPAGILHLHDKQNEEIWRTCPFCPFLQGMSQYAPVRSCSFSSVQPALGMSSRSFQTAGLWPSNRPGLKIGNTLGATPSYDHHVVGKVFRKVWESDEKHWIWGYPWLSCWQNQVMGFLVTMAPTSHLSMHSRSLENTAETQREKFELPAWWAMLQLHITQAFEKSRLKMLSTCSQRSHNFRRGPVFQSIANPQAMIHANLPNQSKSCIEAQKDCSRAKEHL